MALSWPAKDPEEVLDYVVDWSARLSGDQISVSVFTIPVGTVVIQSQGIVDPLATTRVWLTGGTLAETCDILNHITTVAGRQMEQTINLKIQAR